MTSSRSVIEILQTVAPKSDQLNAEDLIGGPRTIKVTRMSAMKEPDQPIAIYFEGGNGKPYKPGKSMRRVLLRIWGNDGASYAGRQMTIYLDDAVQFGGVAVGEIRISHMSGVTEAKLTRIAMSRGANGGVECPNKAPNPFGPSLPPRIVQLEEAVKVTDAGNRVAAYIYVAAGRELQTKQAVSRRRRASTPPR